MSLKDYEDDFGSDEEDFPVVRVQKRDVRDETVNESDSEDENGEEDDDEEDNEGDEISQDEIDKDEDNESEDDFILGELPEDEDISKIESKTKTAKLKKLTPEQLEKEQKRIKKTGVVYLSTIPPYMKPSKLRSILSRFGEVDRLFLKPEDQAIYKKRVKYGGNKKKNYTEGWVEFLNKKDAKLCCATLNGNKIGGKKTSYYYDDMMNIKYLHNFKWMDLTQQISKENEIRQAKLALELSQQQKLNKAFVNNVDQSKMIKGIEKKRKAENKDIEVRRTFKQRDVTSRRADADMKHKKDEPNDQLNGVLSKIF
ncbi:pre-rRNA-processing protein Esf2p [[Candida] jaroonii]|uniref:Pre-rRNA-processing protein Esf2p n=1 Tax=[Candida] jaroonii TaxID=467808 RepID=A0ACA9Y7Q4_9ASCO|nr:pre-rRNA-processing protein Esf2p [[Candida] jaroonii]